MKNEDSLIEKLFECDKESSLTNKAARKLQSLVAEINNLHEIIVTAYKEVSGAEYEPSLDEAVSLLPTACFSTRKQLLKALNIDLTDTKYAD